MSGKIRLCIALLVVLLFAGCMSAQHMRERRINQHYDIFQTFPVDIQEKVSLGQIDIGFIPDMVRIAWGDADRVHTRTTEKGIKTVWTYLRRRTHTQTERMSIPVRVKDSAGNTVIQYRNVWIDRDTEEEYASARVEFTQDKVSAIEQLND